MLNSTNDFLPMPIYEQKNRGIKVATPDILLDTNYLSINTMAEYSFATIGNIELLSASRHDLIDSPLNGEYTSVVDAGTRFRVQPTIKVFDGSSNTFNSFEIDINKHIVADVANTAYKDAEKIIIQLKDLKSNYLVEVEIFNEVDLTSVTI